MSAVCPACYREQHAGLLCHSCTSMLEKDLAAVGGIVHDLEATLARQARISGAGRGGLASEMDPWQQGASITLSTLTNTLTTWARDVSESAGWVWVAAATPPAVQSAAVLLRLIDPIRRHPAVDELTDEIGYAVRVARGQVDRTARRFPVGPCPEDDCPGEVWAYLPVEDTRPSSMECRADEEHTWTTIQWMRVGRRMLDKMEQQKRKGSAA